MTEITQMPPAAQGWVDLYNREQDLARHGPAETRQFYADRVAVMKPTVDIMTGSSVGAPPIFVGLVSPNDAPGGIPSGQARYAVSTPANVDSGNGTGHPKPTPVDDSHGHTVGHIQATDPGQYDAIIQEACDYYGKLYGITIDPNLIKAHIWQESKGDPWALSQDGQQSRGLMQVSNSPGVPTAAILAAIKNPDGSDDPNIPAGGGNQYDPRTSIFTGVKYDALAMSGKMGSSLKASGLPPTELGSFPDRPLTQLEAMRAYQGGPGVLTNPTPASETYGQQLTGLKLVFDQGTRPSDTSVYTNPGGGPGWKEPDYGSIV